MPAPLNILHMHSSFDVNGSGARAARLMSAFGDRARHTIVSGVPDAVSARDVIASSVKYEIAQDPPPLTGLPSVGRFETIAKYMRRFDLVLSYDWGAIDAVMARRAFPKNAPPVVHHEESGDTDGAARLKARRTVYRRIAFGAAHAVVVPSVSLEHLAKTVWKIAPPKLQRIANGIRTTLYARQPDPKAIPGLDRKPGEVVVGAIAELRADKNLPALVRAVAGCPSRIRLVIVGDGPERARIEQTAANMAMTDQLVMPGALPDPHRYIGLFDILSLASLHEQFPLAVVEGMAAGLPIAAPNVGDMLHMVVRENWPLIDQHRNEVGLRDVIQEAAANPAGRATVGKLNRAKAAADYDEKTMIAAYRALYEEAVGRAGCLT